MRFVTKGLATAFAVLALGVPSGDAQESFFRNAIACLAEGLVPFAGPRLKPLQPSQNRCSSLTRLRTRAV